MRLAAVVIRELFGNFVPLCPGASVTEVLSASLARA
jgi:hypothetical protein